jgi:hypothetical protein
VFFGALNISVLGFADRMIAKAVKAPTGDFRDWDAIRAWAEGDRGRSSTEAGVKRLGDHQPDDHRNHDELCGGITYGGVVRTAGSRSAVRSARVTTPRASPPRARARTPYRAAGTRWHQHADREERRSENRSHQSSEPAKRLTERPRHRHVAAEQPATNQNTAVTCSRTTHSSIAGRCCQSEGSGGSDPGR